MTGVNCIYPGTLFFGGEGVGGWNQISQKGGILRQSITPASSDSHSIYACALRAFPPYTYFVIPCSYHNLAIVIYSDW